MPLTRIHTAPGILHRSPVPTPGRAARATRPEHPVVDRAARLESLSLRTLALLWMALLAATPLNSLAAAFSFQGRLVDGAALATGSYEMTFRLFDQATGGAQIGSDLVLSPVPVSSGLFSVELDFGNPAFSGAGRWLQLSARVAGASTAPETLPTRQPVLAVPYAIKAFSGSGDAAELVTGLVPDARLGPNIARTNEVNPQISALTSRISTLEATVTLLADLVHALPTSTAPTISSDPADPTLLAAGWSPFFTVPAPEWIRGSTVASASARSGHSAVWTGRSWLIWGGLLANGSAAATGAGYVPSLDQWETISELDPPAARHGHSAVWTGTEMIVWGGRGTAGELASGAAYNPETLTWSSLPDAGAPAARRLHVTAWTGARLWVWGGLDGGGLRSDGGTFDPVSRTWAALPTANAPSPRMAAAGVWTGTHVVVWGGEGELGEIATGGLLPMAGGATPGAWTTMATLDAPSARTGQTLVWTGSKVLVWGGQQGGTPVNTGAAFDPVANTWTPLPTTDAPAARSGHVAVWTGREMVVYGGQTAAGTDSAVASGGAFDPATGRWRPLTQAGNPLPRTRATAAWSGSELLVFGGVSGSSPVAALQRLNPQPTWYFYRKP